MKRTFLFLTFLCTIALGAAAQAVTVKWELSDVSNLGSAVMTGADGYTSLLTTSFTKGDKIASVEQMTASGAADGYTAVTYTPAFARLTPATKVTSATDGHHLSFGIKPAAGHTLKIRKISFDVAKCGTDGGSVDAVVKSNGTTVATLSPVTILRNKIDEGNAVGYGHNEFTMSELVADENGLNLMLYFYNLNGADNSSPKSMAFRNIVIEGVVDEPVYDVSYFLSAFTCMAKTGTDAAAETDLYSLVKGLKNGQSVRYTKKLYANPTDFVATLQPAVAGSHTVATVFDESSNTLNVSISRDGTVEFTFAVIFSVTSLQPKGNAVALKRGLMAIALERGTLVSWRARKADSRNVKFYLYSGDNAASQTMKVNGGNPIVGKTNFKDVNGKAGKYYRLVVTDANGNELESEVSGPAWSNQNTFITLEGGAPKDPTPAGATYTPNDASYCDMDGDGEYEIILKWAPSNEKDAASSGTTSPAFYACYKLSGRRLWMLHTGHNMFNSAHTTPFVAWDMDGDGFGEFMVKTAPGAVDGEGNYVLMDGDDPTADLKSGRGKQDKGPEYLTVFDGTTGAELKTIKYHTAYADVTTSFWGDSNQNRSERYLAAIAWLDGEDANPSAIFARGYYNGCRIGAYDWDGQNLTLRWLHSGESATKGTVTYADGTVKNLSKTVYGEGAHWIGIGDVTGDGRQEIHYGSGALNADGTTLYRTGLGHGDALHLGDFIPSRPGQEYFMAHEEKSSNGNYGVDLRDARTGEILVRRTAGSDTGRGLMGHFNPEADDAYFFDSADGGKDAEDNFYFNLYDTSGTELSKIGFGSSGATANNRIFWNGTLADDFFDKSIVCQFNPETMGFDRMQVNGGNYTVGILNNDSKHNPCVLGDLLGDWREEIVTWQQSGTDYQLVINATNYETSYTLPHLMDDAAYRAQVISQNDGYNQPPHVSYDPRTEKALKPRTVEKSTEGMTSTALKGNYWGTLYTTYPVIIPEGVTAWSVARTNNAVDTLVCTQLADGGILPADRAIVFNAATASPVFYPTTKASTVTVSNTYAKGYYCDTLVVDLKAGTSAGKRYAYEFRDGVRGLGFYRTHGKKVIAGGEAFLWGATAMQGESYVFGFQTGITDVKDVSISDLGFATYVTTAHTDFSGTGVTAYKARVNGDHITLTEVQQAPKGTPLIISGQGAQNVKVLSSAPAAVADNDLKAGVVTGDGQSYYALGQQNGRVGFGPLKEGVILDASKAYIPASALGQTAHGFYEIDFGTTGVDRLLNADGERIGTRIVHNMNGQRVAQPGKGLYIVNGKKVVIK